jgi:ATP-dependent DNA ligase
MVRRENERVRIYSRNGADFANAFRASSRLCAS